MGRIGSRTTNALGQPSETVDYQHSADDQLLSAVSSSLVNEGYAYDGTGNRDLIGYVTGANNQLLSDGVYTYTYDAEGNRTSRTETATGLVETYTWDHRNRLTSVSTGGLVVSYLYDAFDNVVARTVTDSVLGVVSEEAYVHDIGGKQGLDDLLLVVDGATGEVTRRFLHGPGVDQILAEQSLNSLGQTQTVWAVADQLGSVRGWLEEDTSADQTLIANWITYDSFGNVVSQTDATLGTFHGYTGRWSDGLTGLQNNRARWYDAAAGRWISEDPIGFAAGDVNISRYVGNAVTSFVDPSGLQRGGGGRRSRNTGINTGGSNPQEVKPGTRTGSPPEGFRTWEEYERLERELHIETGLRGTRPHPSDVRNFRRNLAIAQSMHETRVSVAAAEARRAGATEEEIRDVLNRTYISPPGSRINPKVRDLEELANRNQNGPNRASWTQVCSDYRAVIRDIEAHTNSIIPNVQRRLLSEQLRRVDHRQPVSEVVYRRLQAEYRENRSAMIEAWESNTRQIWPTGAQAHHIILSRYGGPNEWWNIHPAYRNVHQPGIHGAGGPTQRVFPTPLPKD